MKDILAKSVALPIQPEEVAEVLIKVKLSESLAIARALVSCIYILLSKNKDLPYSVVDKNCPSYLVVLLFEDDSLSRKL